MSEITGAAVLNALARHIGRDNGVSCARLVTEIVGPQMAAAPYHERRLRKAIEALRHDGHHICGHPASGYYIAANAQELDDTCAFLYERAMTTLAQIAAMKRVSVPDLRGQLHLPT